MIRGTILAYKDNAHRQEKGDSMKELQHTTRILVVDDDESLRGMISMVLEEDGHVVVTASSGEEALELFKMDPFPLVITDIRMDGMSGIELLKEIKKMDSEGEVVVITSYASVDSAVAALRAGAYDYLVKPFDELDLISSVVNRASEKIRLTIENRTLVSNLTQNRHELEQLNRTLQSLAVCDGLTGLYNHRYFQEAVTQEAKRCRRYGGTFSLLFLDVDHFKIYNDTNGHPEGDSALKKIAEILSAKFRQTDVIARYGGEEFVAILPETPKVNALICAEQVRLLIANGQFTGGMTQPLGMVSVSIGVAAFPDDGDDVDEIVRNADDALYRAKESGRNRVSAAGVE